jgi:hypothetical protein
MLGNFYISERMFDVADRGYKGYVTLADYLIYNDIMQFGTEEEKDLLSFKMIAIGKTGIVTLQEMTEFWSKFIDMYQ